MKQFTIALVAASNLANTIFALVETPLWDDWDLNVPECWSERPATCTGNDSVNGNCPRSTVCAENDCVPVRQLWCLDECPEG